jgi:hypothetical protein
MYEYRLVITCIVVVIWYSIYTILNKLETTKKRENVTFSFQLKILILVKIFLFWTENVGIDASRDKSNQNQVKDQDIEASNCVSLVLISKPYILNC